jgi:copper chaperone CopZ
MVELPNVTEGPAMSDTTRTIAYTVTGMTCGHCVNAVTEEVGKVNGVDTVAVDLEPGHVTVTGTGYTDEQIAAAVDEAGYSLVHA